ncbi:MAG: secondary thiamine-phosphate synthase enzyme YjbQ [Planctomycetota bacterium]
MESFKVKTGRRAEFVDITAQVQGVVRDSGIRKGVCHIYVPHTTAGLTINENADPAVPADIIAHLEKLVPRSGDYRHAEGNSDSHIKASMMGFSETVLVENGALVLGTWQCVYFCEFDGPRNRTVYVQVIAA